MLGRLGLGFANVAIIIGLAMGCGESTLPGGGGAGGAAPIGGCETARDCPTTMAPCSIPACNDGYCTFANAPVETTCGPSAVCTEDGQCVDCVRDSDCATSEACLDASCQDGTCTATPKSEGTVCKGGACSEGTCVTSCAVDTDCPAAACKVAACVDGRCE